jgi:hypothetical protein
MTDRLSNEQIAAIRDGCEGVTPGPWRRYSKSPHVARDTARPDPHPNVGSVLVAECGNYRDKELVPFNMDRWLADAAHIARCDPDTIHALATEVLESRAEIERLVAEVADAQLSEAHANQSCIRGNLTIRALTDRVAELEGALDAAHYYIDASTQELTEAGMTRDGALDNARRLRTALGRDGA